MKPINVKYHPTQEEQGLYLGMVQITPVLVNTLRAESYPDVL